MTLPLFVEAPKLGWGTGGERRRVEEGGFVGDANWGIYAEEDRGMVGEAAGLDLDLKVR